MYNSFLFTFIMRKKYAFRNKSRSHQPSRNNPLLVSNAVRAVHQSSSCIVSFVKTETEKTRVVYDDPKLEKQLEKINQSSSDRMDIVKNDFTHTIQETALSKKKYIVFSEEKEVGMQRRNPYFLAMFENKIKPHKWTFHYNFKEGKTGFYANDAFRFQYEKISKENGFYGQLPSMIKRDNVVNKITLSKIEGLESGSKELLEVFLKDTPNGKSTQRVLEDFGLVATKVEVKNKVRPRRYHNGSANFYVHIKPTFLYDKS